MPKSTRTIRTACELPDGALIQIHELAEWIRVPVKTIYNGGQGTSTLPCVFLDAEKKRHRRWRVGAVRAWLLRHEVTAALTPAPSEAKVVSIGKRRKAKSDELPEADVLWFQQGLAKARARLSQQS